jgi:threonine dehydratase
VPEGDAARFAQHLRELSYVYTEETDNPAYRMFLGD